MRAFDLQKSQAGLEFDPRFFNYKSTINVVFGAAVGAYIGLQFSKVGNDVRSFLTLSAILMLLNGFVLGMMGAGSQFVRNGFKGNVASIVLSFCWMFAIIGLSEWQLHQGWIYAAIMLPWWFVASSYAFLLHIMFVWAPKKMNTQR